MDYPLDFASAYGQVTATGNIRCQPDDFQVDEVLGFEPCGEGEHLYMHIRKTGLNTLQLAGRLAGWAGIHSKDVGFAGLKDRHAVTSQWFSLYLPIARDLDWQLLADDQLELLGQARHRTKLRRGDHKANRFRLKVRNFSGDADQLSQKIAQIATEGVPNYFGEQRFGHGGSNLNGAHAMWSSSRREKNRQLRGFYLSAARAWLFNRLLSERVTAGCWRKAVEGDCLEPETGFPTGPLWGRGRLPTRDQALVLESKLSRDYPLFCDGLEHAGLKQERRSLVLQPKALHADLSTLAMSAGFEISFELPGGAFATSLLAELVNWTDSHKN